MSDDYFAENDRTAAETVEGSGGATLTLAAIETLTGISYVTLQRYAQAHGDRLPHEGEGRNRKYYPEAVDVFKEIREESQNRRGRSTGPGQGQGQDTPKKSKKGAVKKAAGSKPGRGHGSRRVQRAATPSPAPPAIIPPDPATLAYRRAQIMMELQTVEKILKPILEEQARLQGSLTELDLAAAWPTS